MPQVFEIASQANVDMPEGQIADAWQSGKVHLLPGSRFDVRMPTGEVVPVNAENLHTAIQNRGQIISSGEAKAHQAQLDYSGPKGALIAGAAGLGEQATLGLGEQLLPDDWKQAIQQSEAMHPWVHATGEMGGAAALTAVLPGGGLAGLAERGAGAVLGGTAKTALGRVASRAAVSAMRDAAAGAQYGVARSMSESALDPSQHPLTAASILSEVGGDALWGGAIGSLLGGLHGGVEEMLAGKTPKLDSHLADGRSPAPEDIQATAGKAIGTEGAEGLGPKLKNWYAKLAAGVSGKSADDIRPFLEEDNRAILDEAAGTRDEASRAIRDHVDSVLDAGRQIQAEGERTLKRGHVTRLVEGVDPEAAAKAARDMADKTVSSLHEMLSMPEVYGGETYLKRALSVAAEKQGAISQAIDDGDVAAQYALTDELKKSVGTYTKGAQQAWENARRSGTDELVISQNKARSAKLKEIYENVRTGLEDEDIWKQAAVAQRDVNQAWSRQIDASQRFHRALTTNIGRDPEDPWGKLVGVDPGKADAYVRNLTNPNQDLTHKAVTDFVSSSRDLAKSMSEQWELPPEKLAQVDRLGKAASAFQTTLDKTTKTLTLVNQFERLQGQATGHAQNFLTAAGYMMGGIPGGIIGKSIGKVGQLFTDPAKAIMQVARIEGMVRRSDGRIGRAVRGLMRGSERAPSVVDASSFERKSAQVATMAAQPQVMVQRIRANLGELGQTSPGLSRQLMTTSMAGMALLQSKLPQKPPADPLNPMQKMPPPPIGQRESWLRYYRAVKDPHSVVEDLHAGRLTPEGVEVLQTVYPPLYQRVQELTFEELAKGGGSDMTRQQRLGLAMMLALPTPDTSPDYVMQRQAAFVPQAPEQSPAGTSKRSKPYNAKPLQSPSERVESGSSAP